MDKKQAKFLSLYKPVKKNLWRYCLFLTRDKHNAEDLLAESISQAYVTFDKLKSGVSFLSFLFTIAHRCYYKSIKNRDKIDKSDIDFDELFSIGNSPEVITDAKIILETLEELSPEQREALLLSEVDGFSRKEIAEIQQVAEDTVKSRLYRAKLKIREILELNK